MEFECTHCNFSTIVKANFIRHNGTAKHLKCLESIKNQETQKSIPNSRYLEELEKMILELENENKMLKTELQIKAIEIDSKNDVIKSKDEFINYMKNISVPYLTQKYKEKIKEDKKDKEKIKEDKKEIKIDNELNEIEYIEHELNAFKKLEDKVDYLTKFSPKYAQKWINHKLVELL